MIDCLFVKNKKVKNTVIGGTVMSKQKKNQQQRKNQVESPPGQEDKKLKGPNRPST